MVRLDAKYYEAMIDIVLQDRNNYLPVDKDPTEHIMKIRRMTVQEAVSYGFIQDSRAAFLMILHPRASVIYGLPKIYKQEFLPSARPIISASDLNGYHSIWTVFNSLL